MLVAPGSVLDVSLETKDRSSESFFVAGALFGEVPG